MSVFCIKDSDCKFPIDLIKSTRNNKSSAITNTNEINTWIESTLYRIMEFTNDYKNKILTISKNNGCVDIIDIQEKEYLEICKLEKTLDNSISISDLNIKLFNVLYTNKWTFLNSLDDTGYYIIEPNTDINIRNFILSFILQYDNVKEIMNMCPYSKKLNENVNFEFKQVKRGIIINENTSDVFIEMNQKIDDIKSEILHIKELSSFIFIPIFKYDINICTSFINKLHDRNGRGYNEVLQYMLILHDQIIDLIKRFKVIYFNAKYEIEFGDLTSIAKERIQKNEKMQNLIYVILELLRIIVVEYESMSITYETHNNEINRVKDIRCVVINNIHQYLMTYIGIYKELEFINSNFGKNRNSDVYTYNINIPADSKFDKLVEDINNIPNIHTDNDELLIFYINNAQIKQAFLTLQEYTRMYMHNNIVPRKINIVDKSSMDLVYIIKPLILPISFIINRINMEEDTNEIIR